MAVTTFSSREFNQHKGRATKATANGPVFITDRGKPSLVLMSIEEYQRITGAKRNIIDTLSMPGLEDIDIDLEAELPNFRDRPTPPDLS